MVYPAPVLAGPPFVTDDPEPTPYGQFETYLYSAGTKTAGNLEGTLVGLEVDYGAAPDLQLTANIPVSFQEADAGEYRFGTAPVQLGAKYRFVEEEANGLQPQLAVFPTLAVPENGSGGTQLLLPLWAQKSMGEWTTFGGGGYELNPGAGNRNFWVFGWGVLRHVTDVLAVGAEAFGQTANLAHGRESHGFNLAGIYDFSDTYHFVASAGRGFRNAEASNEFSYYAALELTF